VGRLAARQSAWSSSDRASLPVRTAGNTGPPDRSTKCRSRSCRLRTRRPLSRTGWVDTLHRSRFPYRIGSRTRRSCSDRLQDSRTLRCSKAWQVRTPRHNLRRLRHWSSCPPNRSRSNRVRRSCRPRIRCSPSHHFERRRWAHRPRRRRPAGPRIRPLRNGRQQRRRPRTRSANKPFYARLTSLTRHPAISHAKDAGSS
jgi:hypothetical protein